MRRKYLGFAIAAIATLGPAQAWGGDREIAEEIIERLKAKRDSGALKDFTLDMKVDQGVVLFRGSVSEAAQKQLVLKAADGVDGIARVVDKVKVTSGSETAPKAVIAETKPESAAGKAQAISGFSFREALAARAEAIRGGVPSAPATPAVAKAAGGVVPGVVMPTAATEPAEGSAAADDDVTAAVVKSLRKAKRSGQLKGFGVDVQAAGGVVELTGQAGSKAQRDLIVRLAKNTPGVSDVRESIQVAQVNAELPRLPQPPVLQEPAAAGNPLAPVTVEAAPVSHQRVAGPVRATAARRPAAGRRVPARPAAAQMHGAPMASAPVMGQPVPMSPPTMGAGAPRYDSPYLPNYAWPGYAAYPNYAAVSYPQQYSPSAWPYIGPFYPYPQVPLGWRRVSLEWDDGWWFLDFTDK